MDGWGLSWMALGGRLSRDHSLGVEGHASDSGGRASGRWRWASSVGEQLSEPGLKGAASRSQGSDADSDSKTASGSELVGKEQEQPAGRKMPRIS
ncbi:hypothetical protein PG985_007202 [Apiospora marii]|uniref:uncharacterized protein n=1 Tax=Apiospora marii TaxID=335849 RepID=UPI003131F63D